MPCRDHRSSFSVLPLVVLLGSALSADALADATNSQAAVQLPADLLSASLDADLNSENGGASNATEEQAAIFAWRQFIALNWPAQPGRRGVPARAALDAPGFAARVWETYRSRVEIYPGSGAPFATAAHDYEYEAGPRYRYDPRAVGTPDGQIAPCHGQDAGSEVPWNNLDEKNNNLMRAGLSPRAPYPGQRILQSSKANRPAYVYVASRGWYGAKPIRRPVQRTGEYVRTHLRAPPPGVPDDPDDTGLISFPNGAMELKGAWRRLGHYDDPETFHVARVRYYEPSRGGLCYRDSDPREEGKDHFGLIAFHIAYKTPSAPYFIWATFEHASSLVLDAPDGDGRMQLVEHPDGRLTQAGHALSTAHTPNVRFIPATVDQDQRFVAGSASPTHTPQLQLYFRQEAWEEIPAVDAVGVNRRMHPISNTIVSVNAAVHRALAEQAVDSPLRHYRLVAVQWKPLSKPAGQPYAGHYAPSIYYAASSVIEGPPVTQAFSGQFASGFAKTSDYLNQRYPFVNPPPNPGAPVFLNTYFDGEGFLAGGCMGCHGGQQSYGTDWSFMLDGQRVREPELEP